MMRVLLKLSLLMTPLFLLFACSKSPSVMGAENISSTGIGQFSHFAGQEPGESYTTMAPHNQLYLFSYDDSTINPKYLPSIKAQAGYLNSHPNAFILLAGHTDERGSREYNVALGERRAKAVLDLMLREGASRSQLRMVSYGKERPINLGHDEASHMQNRRVELTYEVTR